MKMPSPAESLKRVTRKNLDNFIARDLWDGHDAKAELKIIEVEGHRYVVKDFAGKGLLARAGMGGFLISREWKIYSRLQGIEGIPKIYRRIDSEAFIMEYVKAKPLKDFHKQLVPDEFIERLENLVSKMHSRGVIHLDLHQRRNILVTEDWKPYLVDFATSICFGRSAFAQEVLVPIFRKFDISGILKIKKWHAPGTFTGREIKKLERMEKLRKLWIFTPVHVSKRKPPCPQAKN